MSWGNPINRPVAYSVLCGVAAIVLPGCASIDHVPSPLRTTALCVAESLRKTPDIWNVDVVVRNRSNSPISITVSYNFRVAPWNHRYVAYAFWDPGNGTIWGGFQGTPGTWEMTRAITSKVQSECRTGPIGFA